MRPVKEPRSKACRAPVRTHRPHAQAKPGDRGTTSGESPIHPAPDAHEGHHLSALPDHRCGAQGAPAGRAPRREAIAHLEALGQPERLQLPDIDLELVPGCPICWHKSPAPRRRDAPGSSRGRDASMGHRRRRLRRPRPSRRSLAVTRRRSAAASRRAILGSGRELADLGCGTGPPSVRRSSSARGASRDSYPARPGVGGRDLAAVTGPPRRSTAARSRSGGAPPERTDGRRQRRRPGGSGRRECRRGTPAGRATQGACQIEGVPPRPAR